ncbi:anaerobic dehydrogenase, typically selenocysteine-containing [Desulfosporosinus acidiphilus SJ4]|uniref:Anaerobic dehydrogenase, typically selenocysteine-containing n=1 Tax=Desulfosporosinus acidiphilus (strain DSM 22704 / JCM 16185 / SJ4) TaxID=646529 RepID=I4D4L5_DESAJ|nr:molybdopterin-dependent oxidoreductase [Desulfosporosinus acidiphilus]AFM40739.1 anaerobic dehydrogenase, typically selenocysteine-containing [Desulfosporosinus acidiphilus SJ4]
MKSEFRRSVCPYDCPDTCGLKVELQEGKVVRVTGDPEHPFTKGTLCPKMAHYERTVYSEERLTSPLLRSGKKGTGQFQAITWDEAIAHITNRWQDLISQFGAETILPYSYAGTMGVVQRNCGESFFNRLGASRLARTICSSAKGYGWTSVMGETLAPHPNEVMKSDLIILWGTNALATNIHFIHNVREAKKRGAKVWLIDTYETPTAKIADKIFCVRPGSDGALALGIMHILVQEGLQDQMFLNEYVQGFEAFRQESLHDFPPAKVSQITGLEINQIEELALGYARARAPFISLGSGISRYGNGAMTVRLITCLPAVVGAWNKPGGGLLTSISLKTISTATVIREDFLRTPTRLVNMNQLGFALTELKDPPIKSLYVYHSNPAVIAPDQNQILKGLRREDLFTVVHERFMTDTARYADIILPATSSLEHSDLYRSYGSYVVQRAAAVIPPLGQAKSNWEVFQLLAEAMKFGESFFKQSADDLIDQFIIPSSSGLSESEKKKLSEGHPVEVNLPLDYKMRFQTPSGKIELYNPKEPAPLPYYFAPHGDNAPFFLMSTPNLFSLNSSFNERKDLVSKKKAAYLLMNVDDAAERNLQDLQPVVAFNERGEVNFILKTTPKVPRGVVVTEGLFWNKDSDTSSVNALTSQRLTDRASASTLYDVKVDVRSGS